MVFLFVKPRLSKHISVYTRMCQALGQYCNVASTMRWRAISHRMDKHGSPDQNGETSIGKETRRDYSSLSCINPYRSSPAEHGDVPISVEIRGAGVAG